jgi:vancomycin permeability regulator SanA
LVAIGVANAWVLAQGANARRESVMGANGTVAIVPGSRVENGQPLEILEGRLQASLDLYRAGRVKTILVSGNDTKISPEVTVMSAWLVERGVPRKDILADPGGHRTRATMVRAAGVFEVKRAIVCTETLSMPRSLFLARSAGIDAEGFELPTDLSRVPRFVAREALKNTLAFVESQLLTPFERPPVALAER